jgi:hypothetical protein
MQSFIERHIDKIAFSISCYDRVVLSGTLVDVGHAGAMTGFIRRLGRPIFDYPDWANQLRLELRGHAESIARREGLEIEFIQKADFRKEARIRAIVSERGNRPGIVHIFSAMESCTAFRPWHDKHTGHTFLKPTSGKCLHYYFYFILPDLGLGYLRVPTWAPFRLQFYFNGHNELARKLDGGGIGYTLLDNAFIKIDNPKRAQQLADSIRPDHLHRQLDDIVREYCPIVRHFTSGYHWSIMQAEYATDIVFKRQQDLTPLYEELVRTAIHSVKPDHVATFLGRKLTEGYQDELGNDFHTRIQGTRIKHHMGWAAIKMYDKQGIALRIETTVNDVSLFKHYRKGVHRDGAVSHKIASVKKTIYSLKALSEIMAACNHRYLEFLSAIDDPSNSIKDLNHISRPARDDNRTYRGFNLFDGDDLDLFHAITRGEFNINGFRNRDLCRVLTGNTTARISRTIKRLRKHGLIKKVRHTYKYYLSALGRRVTMVALKLREMFIIPSLRGGFPA